MHSKEPEIIVSQTRNEFRRGTLVLAVLSSLLDKHHGYRLRKMLARHGLDIEDGTLYPLLRRLESRGLLKGEWDEEGGHKRLVYCLSQKGRAYLCELAAEWERTTALLAELLQRAGSL